MENHIYIEQRSKKKWTVRFSNGDSRDFSTQEAAERFCAKLGKTPTTISPQQLSAKKTQPAKKKKRKLYSHNGMPNAEFRRLQQIDSNQKRGRIYGTASPKGTLSASSFPAYVKIEQGGAIETNKNKF